MTERSPTLAPGVSLGSSAPTGPDDDFEAEVSHEPYSPPTVRLTRPALEALREQLVEEELLEEGGVRFTVSHGAGCSTPLHFGILLEVEPAEGDLILEGGGIRIFLAPERSWAIDGLEVDYVEDGPLGEGFAFRHPRGGSAGRC